MPAEFGEEEIMDITLIASAFVTAACLAAMIAVLVSGHHGRLAERLKGITPSAGPEELRPGVMEQMAVRMIPRIAVPLVPQDESEQGRLKVRLIRAGYYGDEAMTIFLGMKMLFIVLPLIVAASAGLSGTISTWNAVLLGAMGSILGYLLPDYWLRSRQRERQAEIRKSLPDALDMMVVCADAGLSLDAAMQRVGKELRLAHPLLANELRIVNRSMEMGMSAPEGLDQLNGRFDLQELRYLATIVREAERFGTSVVKSIRVHADTLRTQRLQRAEEAARKSSVKMLFPTILFIFPVIFLVVLVPSVLHIWRIVDQVVNSSR